MVEESPNTMVAGLQVVAPPLGALAPVYPDLLVKPEAIRTRLLLRREELLRLLLSGHRVKECAAKLRISDQAVRKEMKNPYFLDRVEKLSKSVYEYVDQEIKQMKSSPIERLSQMTEQALDEMEELLNSDDDRVKLRACQDVLDRNIETSKTKRIQSEKRVITLDIAKMQQAAQTAKEVDDFERARAAE